MAGRLSRRARARQAMRIEGQIASAVRDLDSPDENVRAEAVRQLCPCRTHLRWTLDRHVVPMLRDESPLVRFAANFVLTEELEHEMIREARAAQPRGVLPHFVWTRAAAKPPNFRTETDLYPVYRVGMDMKIELILLPVSDVDRAKHFYVDQVGFHADFDHTVNENLRFVQLTPPGSACSIAIGKGITDKSAGSVGGLLMVVQDVDQAHRELFERGVAVTDVHQEDWGRFTEFSDPDGNSWSLQQLPKRG